MIELNRIYSEDCLGGFINGEIANERTQKAIACLNTNRKGIMIEKDEHYFNVGKKRVEEHIFNGTRLQDND